MKGEHGMPLTQTNDLALTALVLDNVDRAVIALSADGRVALFNPAAEAISTWPPAMRPCPPAVPRSRSNSRSRCPAPRPRTARSEM